MVDALRLSTLLLRWMPAWTRLEERAGVLEDGPVEWLVCRRVEDALRLSTRHRWRRARLGEHAGVLERRSVVLVICSFVAIHLRSAGSSRTPTPSVLLFAAAVDEARDLAVDSAYVRGWAVRTLGQDSAEFEQVLDEGDPADPLAPRRMIQISAFFMDEPPGVRVLLRAHELEVATTREQWSTDVTDRYAERYAESRGCELTPAGAVLEASGPDWEEHRIGCRGGRSDAGAVPPW